MNVKEYIASGILEAYALGALSPEEAGEVEANVARYPELAEELRSIEDVMQSFAASQAVAPASGVQQRIWSSLQETSEPAGRSRPGGRTIALEPEFNNNQRFKYAAVWGALLGSLVLNVLLWSQGREMKKSNRSLSARVEKMDTSQQRLASLVGEYEQNKSMMADTGMQTVVMHTMKKGHPMAAMVYWSKAKGEAYVSVAALPMPPKGMQYQLWVMQDGKPVDMGVIPTNMSNTPAMQKVDKPVMYGEAFAITLEREGGSPTPSMDNIYVMGRPS